MRQILRLSVAVLLASLQLFAQDAKQSSKISESAGYAPRIFTGKKNKPAKPDAKANPALSDARLSFPVTVFDAEKRPVTDLKREEFTVLIDGEPSVIERSEINQGPINIVLMLDSSPSTFIAQDGKTDYGIMKEMSARLISLLQPDDKVMVVSFGEKLRVMNEFTSDRTMLEKSLKKVEMGSGTGLYSSLTDLLEKHLSASNYPIAVVLMTDGVDTTSGSKTTYESSLMAAERLNIPIYPVFFDTFPKAQKAAAVPPGVFNGGSISPKKEDYDLGRYYLADLILLSGSRGALAEKFIAGKDWGLDRLPQELRSQYRLTVKLPSAGTAGTRHSLKTKVDRPNLTVLAKGSYIE